MANSEATVVLPIDETSTGLLEDALTGKLMSEVAAVFERDDNGKTAPYFTYTFHDVGISSYELQDGSTGASVQITFSYASIAVQYAQADTAGSPVPSGWDVVTTKIG